MTAGRVRCVVCVLRVCHIQRAVQPASHFAKLTLAFPVRQTEDCGSTAAG